MKRVMQRVGWIRWDSGKIADKYRESLFDDHLELLLFLADYSHCFDSAED
jgi:hypothetical protein